LLQQKKTENAKREKRWAKAKMMKEAVAADFFNTN
jgi:hypothetical protein